MTVTLTAWDEAAPHIWVGCLACYNDGRLVGDWYMAVDGDQLTSDDLHKKPLSPMYPHEEIWVMDHENFHGLLKGECAPFEATAYARALAEIQELCDDVGLPVEVGVGVIKNIDADTKPEEMADLVRTELDHYLGSGKLADICESYYWERLDPQQQKQAIADQMPWLYVDWDRVANDWSCNGTWSVTVDGTDYWFEDHGSHGETSIFP